MHQENTPVYLHPSVFYSTVRDSFFPKNRKGNTVITSPSDHKITLTPIIYLSFTSEENKRIRAGKDYNL